MKKFVSLVKKEWHDYKLWLILLIFAGAFFIGVLPTFADRLPNLVLSPSDVRLTAIFMGGTVLYFVATIQFILSIRRDIKMKEIWLHSTRRITTLIGAKFCFSVIWVTALSFIYGLASYFVGDALQGEIQQLIFFHMMYVLLAFLFVILFTVTALVFYAIYLQLKRYIGLASIVVTGISFFLYIYIFVKWTESVNYGEIMYVGEVSLAPLEKFFPSMYRGETFVVGHVYVMEELFSIVLLVGCFIVASKWIERVITR
ncbi:hypothetical protein [Lysinibacillus sp. LZ02]|uniref:hypothetical protein n=1 Tax=Lysinibacillus sp. LZ02 TaxID=3420668 RepID=UPI003D362FB8